MDVEKINQYLRQSWIRNMTISSQYFYNFLQKYNKISRLEISYRDIVDILPSSLHLIFKCLQIKPIIIFSSHSYIESEKEIKFNFNSHHPTELVLYSTSIPNPNKPIIILCSTCLSETYVLGKIIFCQCRKLFKYDNLSSSRLRKLPLYNRVEYPIVKNPICFRLLDMGGFLFIFLDYKIVLRVHDDSRTELWSNDGLRDIHTWKFYTIRESIRDEPTEVFQKLLYHILCRFQT